MTALSACPACAAAPMPRTVALSPARPDMILSVPDIHCAACIGKVERGLSALPGVISARVNLSIRQVAITAPTLTQEAAVDALSRIGFAAYPLDLGTLAQAHDDAGRALLTRLAVAGFAMMNVMLLSVAVWSGAVDATRDLFHLISAAIALPAVAFSAQPFFISALRALRVRTLNMDVPISLAILLAAGMSLFETLNGGAHAYFDAALSLTFFLLIGRYLDHRSRAATRSAAAELAALEVQTATRMVGGKALQVPVSALAIGDAVLIRSGMRVPVDGRLMDAAASTDRSLLTGESAPVQIRRDAMVLAGEVNLGAPFTLIAAAVGADTTLRRVAALVATAESGRNRYTALADRAARIYAPAVHLLAFAAFIGWAAYDGDVRHALNVAIAVLIITCPCALGLAVPAVSTAAIGMLYRKGVLVKSGTALERLAEVDTVVFDKTGTLTMPGARQISGMVSDTEAAIALALAQASSHPVAAAIAAGLQAHAPASLSAITEWPGKGVEARLGADIVRLGKASWVGGGVPQGTAFRIGTAPAISLTPPDSLRPGAREAVDALRARGLDIRIISGDRAEAVARVAAALGIQNTAAEVSAEQKHDMIAALGAQGRKVLMVGDGLNDTAALAAAHVSAAPSSALDASRSAADVILLNDSLALLPLIHATARKATHLSKMNFGIAGAYNFMAVPIALIGLATPLMAALAMSVSSLTVLLNALRVRRTR